MIPWLLACAEGPVPIGDDDDDAAGPRPEVALADMGAWEPAAAADPFDDAPEDGACPLGGTYLEGNTIEIDTGLCTYLWVEQPLQGDLRAGDRVELVYWHSPLFADPPATAHVAFTVDGRVLHERTVPVPFDAAAYTEVVEVAADAPAGAALGLHLHNHGANTWNVLSIVRLAD